MYQITSNYFINEHSIQHNKYLNIFKYLIRFHFYHKNNLITFKIYHFFLLYHLIRITFKIFTRFSFYFSIIFILIKQSNFSLYFFYFLFFTPLLLTPSSKRVYLSEKSTWVHYMINCEA